MDIKRLLSPILITVIIDYLIIDHQELKIILAVILISLGLLSRLQTTKELSILIIGVFFTSLISLDNAIYLIIVILGSIGIYYTKAQYIEPTFYILALNILLINETVIIQFLSILSLLILCLILNLDIRPMILIGIFDLILSAYSFISMFQLFETLSYISYFYLLIGTIGMIFSGSKVKIPLWLVTILIYTPISLIWGLIGTLSGYYYWNPISFYFKLTTIASLWIPGVGYNPEINQFPLFVIAHELSVKGYIILFTFLTGYLTYIALKLMDFNEKEALIGGLLYQISSFFPVFLPYGLLWYMSVPIAIALFKKYVSTKRIIYVISLLLLSILGSSFYLWIATVSLGSLIVNKGKGGYLIPPLILVNSWWIIPYIALGAPSISLTYSIMTLGFSKIALGLVLLTLTSLYFLVDEKRRNYISFFVAIALIYSYFKLPFYQILLPLVSLIAIFLVLDLMQKSGYDKIITYIKIGILAVLIISGIGAIFNAPVISIPPSALNVSKDIYSHNETYSVFWNGSYPLLSSMPLSPTLNHYVKYIITNNFSIETNEIFKGYPVILIPTGISNYIQSKWISTSNDEQLIVLNESSNNQVYNYKIIWILPSSKSVQYRSIETFFLENIPPNSTLFITINSTVKPSELLFAPQYIGFSVIYNGSKIAINSTTYSIRLNGSLYELQIYYANESFSKIIITSMYYIYNGSVYYIINPKIPSYSETSYLIPGGMKVHLSLESNFIVNFSFNVSKFYVGINNGSDTITNISNSTILLHKGNYTITVIYKGEKLIYYGLYVSIISFISTIVIDIIIKHLKPRRRNKS